LERKKEMIKMEEEVGKVDIILTAPRDMGFIGYENGKFVTGSKCM
jgi:hypothetical protein